MKKKTRFDNTKSEWVRKEPYLIDKKDSRYKSFKKQLKTQGFCFSELWSLDGVIAAFILPRLIAFRNEDACRPMDMDAKEWRAILDEMINYFTWVVEDRFNPDTNHKKVSKKGIKLFAKYFQFLWI